MNDLSAPAPAAPSGSVVTGGAPAPAAPAAPVPAPAPAPAAPTFQPVPPAAAPAAPAAEPAKPAGSVVTGLKPGQEPAAAYNLKLPQDSRMTKDQFEKTVTHARERGFSQEQAQHLVERESAAIDSHIAADKVAYDSMVNDQWIKGCQDDPKFGGQSFEANSKNCATLVEKYGDPELIRDMDETGFGNKPSVFRFLSKLAAAAGVDQLVEGAQKPPPAGKPKQSQARDMYGKTADAHRAAMLPVGSG